MATAERLWGVWFKRLYLVLAVWLGEGLAEEEFPRELSQLKTCSENEPETIAAAGGSKHVSISPAVLLAPHNVSDSSKHLVRISDDVEDTTKYWYYNGEAYDVATFIANHPGGEHFLRLTRGRDITPLFKLHHITDKPHRLLQRYKVLADPGSTPHGLRPDYKAIKQDIPATTVKYDRMREAVRALDYHYLLTPTLEYSILQVTVMAATICLWWNVFASNNDSISWRIAKSIALGILAAWNGAFGHNGLHLSTRRPLEACQFFLTQLLTPFHWQWDHCTRHHGWPNRYNDGDWQDVFAHNVLYRISPWLWYTFNFVQAFVYSARSTIQLLSLDVPWYAKLSAPPAVPVGIVIVLLLFGKPRKAVSMTAVWLVSGAIGSAYFIPMANLNHMQDFLLHPQFSFDVDLGDQQLAASAGWGFEWGAVRSLPYLFLNLQPLHHLFPTVHHSKLHELLPFVRQEYKLEDVGFVYSFRNWITTVANHHLNGPQLPSQLHAG